MSGEWRALAFSDVTAATLANGFEGLGLDWEETLHVTATSSLAAAMRRAATPAIALRDLIDLVVWAGMPSDLRIPVTDYPPLTGVRGDFGFPEVRRNWMAKRSGHQIRLGVRANHRLRRHLDVARDIDGARVLRRSVPDLRRAIQSLAAAGIRPADIDPSDGLIETALDAWKKLELEVPEVFRQRDDLWMDAEEFTASISRPAKDLHSRLDAAFEHLLGWRSDQIQIAYHGFYFFTAPQWAWFQMLRNHRGIDQYFVLHDDGSTRVFEIWRRFFVERWNMPVAEPVEGGEEPSAGALLRDALEGRRIDTEGHTDRVRLVEYGTVTEFAADVRARRSVAVVNGRSEEHLFAANTAEVDRLIRRFGFGGPNDSVDLAELPIGQFLLALHACVEMDAGNGYRLVLTEDRLIDMVASGLLDRGEAATSPSRSISAIRRAMPFFRDLSLLADWVERAAVLERLITAEVSQYGLRSSAAPDDVRMASAAANPLRLAPWCDLTDEQVSLVGYAIRRVARIAEQVVATEARDADNYLGWLRSQLARGMQQLPDALREQIEVRMRNSGFGEDELDVEGVIEVVHMLLGRQAEFGLDGESDDEDVPVKEMRNLDALGFEPSQSDVHVTNLVETAFPSRVTAIGWPFDRRCLERSPDVPTVSREIMRAREETAALSDLYLFWLALEGIGHDARLTLSWTRELGNDERNPSPMVSLISAIDARRIEAVASAIGGLSVASGLPTGALPPDRMAPEPAPWNRDHRPVEIAVERVDPIAAASAFACARRFALQWAMGPTTAFQSVHHQLMLFGNVQGALETNRAWGADRNHARRTTKDLWRQFTRGQLMSSFERRRVGIRPGARWQWIYTLGGSMSGSKRIDKAYVAAVNGSLPGASVLVPDGGVLPGGVVDANVCRSCPVKPRCAAAEMD